ncbi:MAG: ribonuclease HI [Gammaproteobacteria bacterium]
MKHVVIFTDGACRGNPGPGGWGALLRYNDHEKSIFGGELDTTNNRMELMAAIKALRYLREPCKVDLHTDSQYLQKGISEWMAAWKKKQWKKSDNKPVKNVDLWKELDQETSRHKIAWHWVKAHNGHRENEIADLLANQAIDELLGKGKEGLCAK